MKEVYVIISVTNGIPDDPLVYKDEKRAERKFRNLLETYSDTDLSGMTEEQIDEVYDAFQEGEDAGLWLFCVSVRPRKAASSARGSSPTQ